MSLYPIQAVCGPGQSVTPSALPGTEIPQAMTRRLAQVGSGIGQVMLAYSLSTASPTVGLRVEYRTADLVWRELIPTQFFGAPAFGTEFSPIYPLPSEAALLGGCQIRLLAEGPAVAITVAHAEVWFGDNLFTPG